MEVRPHVKLQQKQQSHDQRNQADVFVGRKHEGRLEDQRRVDSVQFVGDGDFVRHRDDHVGIERDLRLQNEVLKLFIVWDCDLQLPCAYIVTVTEG